METNCSRPDLPLQKKVAVVQTRAVDSRKRLRPRWHDNGTALSRQDDFGRPNRGERGGWRWRWRGRAKQPSNQCPAHTGLKQARALGRGSKVFEPSWRAGTSGTDGRSRPFSGQGSGQGFSGESTSSPRNPTGSLTWMSPLGLRASGAAGPSVFLRWHKRKASFPLYSEVE